MNKHVEDLLKFLGGCALTGSHLRPLMDPTIQPDQLDVYAIVAETAVRCLVCRARVKYHARAPSIKQVEATELSTLR